MYADLRLTAARWNYKEPLAVINNNLHWQDQLHDFWNETLISLYNCAVWGMCGMFDGILRFWQISQWPREGVVFSVRSLLSALVNLVLEDLFFREKKAVVFHVYCILPSFNQFLNQINLLIVFVSFIHMPSFVSLSCLVSSSYLLALPRANI